MSGKSCQTITWLLMSLLLTHVVNAETEDASTRFVPTFLDGSPTYPAGNVQQGDTEQFTSQTDDSLGPFFGESVTFKGNNVGGKPLTYRYRLDFGKAAQITRIGISGAAWSRNHTCSISGGWADVIQLFDAKGLLLGEITVPAFPNIGNSFQTVELVPTVVGSGNTFFLEEQNCDTTWRYRSQIVVDFVQPNFSATPDVLWPPNHRLASVEITPSNNHLSNCQIVSVSSNELITGADYRLMGPLTVSLRATRAGSGLGRVYTIAVRCLKSGNGVIGNAIVTVPHDQGKRECDDDRTCLDD